MSFEGLSPAEVRQLGGTRGRCSESLQCVAHGLALPCDACELEGTADFVCNTCGHRFKGAMSFGSERDCSSDAEFIRTGRVAFEEVARSAMLALREAEIIRKTKAQRLAEEERKTKEREADEKELAVEAERRSSLRELAEIGHSPRLEIPRSRRFPIGQIAIGITLVSGALWYFLSGHSSSTPSSTHPVKAATQEVSTPSALQSTATTVKTATSALGADVQATVMSNRKGIESVLMVAQSGSQTEIESAAAKAGRSHSFGDLSKIRDRKRARPLNDQALHALERGRSADDVYRIQLGAFIADSFDAEISGNLAIYALRAGRHGEARDLAMYALSLPRGSGKTGRTADWATLAAAYSAIGEAQKAISALYVTLAITPDIAKRCFSAVYSVKNTYGQVLRPATEAMFKRIQERNLSDAPECTLPIAW